MKKSILLTMAFAIPLSLSAHAEDPTNKEECLKALAVELKIQCNALFGEDKAAYREACLAAVDSETEKQCEAFFGSGNFCGTCTSACIDQFPESDPTRVDCLHTCLRNPACKAKSARD